jgi:DNA-binding XRE family transcriptional regulator
MPRTTTKQGGSQARRKETRRAFSFVHSSDQLDRFYGVLGKRIRELRQQQELTQEDLAQKAQISRGYLAQIEMGQRRISLHIALNIAISLHVSVDELLTR